MNNEIIINNIDPQDIIIESDGGSVIGISKVYVNGVNVTVGDKAYVIVPTKVSQLENDENYLTVETDPTVPAYVKAITVADINTWNAKQNLLVSGTNIKTLNGQSLLGSGNIVISGGTATDVQIDGTSITSLGVANILTESLYDEATNKIATMSDVPDAISDLINDSDFAIVNQPNTFTANQDISGDLAIDGNLSITGNSNLNKFSTSEIEIGEWVDGSVLYRQSFSINLPNNSSDTLPTSLTSVTITNIYGYYSNGINTYPINYYDQTSHDRVNTYYNNGDLCFETNFDASYYSGIVTLEYIKE